MGGDDEDILSGDEALVATADILYQRMRSDMTFQSHCARVDLPKLAMKLRLLLANVFDKQSWPEVHVTAEGLGDAYKEFAKCLGTAMNEPLPLGDEALLGAFDVLIGLKKSDPSVLPFYESLRSGITLEQAVEDDEEQENEEEDEANDRANKGAANEPSLRHQGSLDNNEGLENGANEIEHDEGNINAESLETLELPADQIAAIQDTWKVFIEASGGRDLAGEAIFAAILDNAPQLQPMFTSARAVLSMKFVDSLSSIIRTLSQPEHTTSLVGTAAFGHFGWDITESRFSLFRDVMIDLFRFELDARFTVTAQQGWKVLLNYIGGIFIFVKTNFQSRIQILLESWKLVTEDTAKDQVEAQVMESSGEFSGEAAKASSNIVAKALGGWTKGATAATVVSETAKQTENSQSTNQQAMNVPTTFQDMFRFNASVMGFGKRLWFQEVLACYENIVINVANSARLHQECDVLALRISSVWPGQVNMYEFKSCMLASLRSLLPGVWDSEHEASWTWLWENVSTIVQTTFGKPQGWEKLLVKYVRNISEDRKVEMQRAVYRKAFTVTPALQEHFKQSDTRLNFIAARIMDMAVEILRSPTKMVDMISAVGLRHVGYGIPIELIGALVSAYIDVVTAASETSDGQLKEAFGWSLGLLAKITASTIKEGSTIVMKAINVNSTKELKQAIRSAPRSRRSAWMLIVKVGSQDISPLAWSIESGSLEAAGAIIQDLLTIRADRDRYYYGCDDLFGRHPDIIKRLCTDAPTLLPTLLDGLLWRSRLTENNTRRANYYVKHLMSDPQGRFGKSLAWIIRNKDPRIVCHPVVVVVSNTIWKGCAYMSFLYQKSWFFLTLVIFITSQSFLEHLSDGENEQIERTMVFICRCFIYLLSLTQLVYSHAGKMHKSWREKDMMDFFYIPLPAYLENWQEVASLALTSCLFLMLCVEPIMYCWPATRPGEPKEGKTFTETCPDVNDMAYSIWSCIAMLLYYILLIDLAVFSTRVSAYVLVCFRMAYELMLFLLAGCGTILAFSSALSVLKHDTETFDGIPPGSLALFKMLLGMYSDEDYITLENDSWMLVVCCLFLVCDAIFLINLLIAQLNCAYASTYTDMMGFANLKRIKIIVDTMSAVSRYRWARFYTRMNFNMRLEFNEGDIGLAGGLQVREWASENPTTIDTILRYGGSTSPSLPWPDVDDRKDDENARIDRIEHVISKFDSRTRKIEKALNDLMKGAGYGGGSSASFINTTTSSSGVSYSEDHDE